MTSVISLALIKLHVYQNEPALDQINSLDGPASLEHNTYPAASAAAKTVIVLTDLSNTCHATRKLNCLISKCPPNFNPTCPCPSLLCSLPPSLLFHQLTLTCHATLKSTFPALTESSGLGPEGKYDPAHPLVVLKRTSELR